MTVKEIFDLRKQGRIEEAYEAIRPLYAVHRGRYTTLCMFWVAADVFKLRLEQKRYEEAAKILEALKRMLPRVEKISKQSDSQAASAKPPKNEAKMPWEKNETQRDGTSAAAFIASATRRLAKAAPKNTVLSGSLGDSVLTGSPGDSVLIDSVDEKKENSPGEKHPTETTNSQLLTDYPGHMIVSLNEGIIRPLEGISAPQRVVLACLTAHPGYSVPQISASTGIPQKSIERHIAALIEKNLIEHRGSKKTGGYYAL